MTKMLVCGDRNWKDKDFMLRLLDDILIYFGITEIIEGCARGADRTAEEWAIEHDIPVRHFPAQWDTYGKSAGPIRNRQMLKEGRPDMVVAFHESLNTSKGTKNMVQIAQKEGIPVYIFPSGTE